MSSWDSELTAWSMAEAGNFEQSLALFEKLRRNWTTEQWRDVGGFATVLLCVRRYKDAAAAFETANAMAGQDHSSQANILLDNLAAAKWLVGDKEGGAAIWHQVVKGIQAKTIIYSDAAGGVGPGLLLWYAGVSLRNDTLKLDATKHLQKLSKRGRITSWPGPFAFVALGKKSAEEALFDFFGEGRLPKLLERAATDLLLRRRLCLALLCWAANERNKGNESECMRLMKTCADMKNPMLEMEWFLARGEVEVGGKQA